MHNTPTDQTIGSLMDQKLGARFTDGGNRGKCTRPYFSPLHAEAKEKFSLAYLCSQYAVVRCPQPQTGHLQVDVHGSKDVGGETIL